MSNYNRSRKGSKAATVVAIILGLLLAASVTLSLGNYFGGWFESETEIEETDDTKTEDSTETESVSASNILIDNSVGVNSQYIYIHL